jgi:hypothetical protein
MTQFQVALAIIDISVRNYSLYEHTQMMQLKSFLMEYCLQHPE